MGYTCDKSTVIVENTTENIKKTFQEKSYSNKPWKMHTGKKLCDSFEYEETLQIRSSNKSENIYWKSTLCLQPPWEISQL